MRLIYLVLLSVLFSCQSKPTLISEEPTNPLPKDIVLADTRSAFEFAGYHFSGSVSLRSEDFLILKDAKSQKRIMDPDIPQTIERLARRGISPLKSILLISDKKDSIENKKWRWLLKQLDVRDVELVRFEDYREAHPNRIPQAPPERVPVWEVKDIAPILKKADQCFVKWSDEACQ